MITEKQRLANTQNAQSGGVKTTAGKAVSKYNAVKHGILKIVLSDYEGGVCARYYQQLIDELKPVGFLETNLVERIAICCVRLFRVAKAEGEFMRSILDPFTIKRTNLLNDNVVDQIFKEFEKVEVSGYESTITPEVIDTLDQTLLRYETSIENKMYKAIHELQRLQAIRLGKFVPLPKVFDINADNSNS
ncbi:MAG: hypothetical protein HY426_04175 [Candidatus Levybacteria bacterium]|nr:hypothetical protein [Candidatus Levybacteria bacterium]